MSSYVRKKAVRYKFDDNIVKELKKEIEDNKLWETEEELLAKKYKLSDKYEHVLNNFTINGGWDFKYKFTGKDFDEENIHHLFLDFLLDYEYDASGDFENVRELTEKEFAKYKEIFKDFVPNLKERRTTTCSLLLL